jgi:glucuronosyltransferase/2-hydroxyacylsphingosine 1-beta-galactosyltransferase
MSLLARLAAATVEPARLALAALPVLREARRVRRELGVTAPRASAAAPSARFRHRLTLVNTFFGHESPRPLPPYVRLIGPVRSQGAASGPPRLEGEFAAFVDRLGGDGARLVLLSFGQNCALTPPRLRALLGGLKRLLARGAVDGAVWSVSMTPEAWLVEAGLREPGALPDTVLVAPWVPQKLLLESKAVRAFVSHGGAESCGEAFLSATPVLSVPHFSDQPRNSVLIQEAGAGLVLSKRALTPESVERALGRLVAEPSFASAARRLRALAVSRGRLATERAADEVEFVLHHGDGHLRPAGDGMSWLKRNDVDLYLAMAAVGVAAAGAAGALAGAVAARRGR